jgi:prepilin-type N-terminal cleavage/methylation domain-containing protein
MKQSGLFDRRGFSLIELMIAMVLTQILLAHGFQLLVIQHHQYIIQDGIAEAQQNLRAGIDMMSHEIRVAGYGVPSDIQKIVTMKKEEIAFLANLNSVDTQLTERAFSGQTLLSVNSGQDFRAGKRVYLCDAVSCEQNTLAQNGTSRSLSLKEPVGRGQPFEIGSRVNVVNEVRYYLNGEDLTNRKLMREVDQGSISLAEQVVGITFDYLDHNGAATTIPSEVKRVLIEFITTSSKTRPTASLDQKGRNRALSTEVRLRNF